MLRTGIALTSILTLSLHHLALTSTLTLIRNDTNLYRRVADIRLSDHGCEVGPQKQQIHSQCQRHLSGAGAHYERIEVK